MNDSIGNLSCKIPIRRPFALTIPAVTVDESVNGFPTASTHSPTLIFFAFPKATGTRPVSFILITARSVEGSVPINSAAYTRLLKWTSIRSADSMTWLFVTIYPSDEKMTPEPLLTCVRFVPPSPKNQSQYEYDVPCEILLMNTTL